MSNWTRKGEGSAGDIYIAKHGDDVFGDGSIANPYKTLQVLSSFPDNSLRLYNVYVGDGLYLGEDIDVKHSVLFLYADGSVQIDPTGNPSAIGINTTAALEGGYWHGFTVKNAVVGILASSNRGVKRFTHGIISNCNKSLELGSIYFSLEFDHNLIVGIGAASVMSELLDCRGYIRSNTWVDDKVRFRVTSSNYSYTIINCLFDSCTVIVLEQGGGTVRFRNCNFNNCDFEINGTTYADFATAFAAVPQFFENCISQDPLFTDAAAGDYTLQPGSPCLSNSSDGTQIGCYGQGHTVRVDGAGVTTSNLTITNGEADLTSAGTGTFESGDVDMGADRVMGIPRVLGDENYGSDEVVDSDLTRLLPNHRTVEMKLVTDAEITAAGNDLATALSLKPWETFLIGVKIERDSAGRANGAASYDRDSPVPVVARGYRLRATLRDNGVKS